MIAGATPPRQGALHNGAHLEAPAAAGRHFWQAPLPLAPRLEAPVAAGCPFWPALLPLALRSSGGRGIA
jgi:hypothetical protein